MKFNFESMEVCSLSDKELFGICRSLNRKIIILMNILTTFVVIALFVGVLSLFYDWNWLFVVCIICLVDVFHTYKNIPIKFRQRLLKMPDYVFEDDYFYVGEKQHNYTDIDMFEMGSDFGRIKMGKYKLVLIFKGRDKSEMDMLIAKLKANAKQYKEV